MDASSRASADTHSRRWRNSLGATEERDREQSEQNGDGGPRSRRQTTSSDQGRIYVGRASPIARRSLQTFGVKKRSLQSPAGSDAEKSSGGEMRDRNESRKRNASDPRRSRFHLSLDLRSTQSPVDDEKQRSIPSFTLADLRTDAFPSNKSQKSQTLPVANPDASISTEAFDPFVKPKSHTLGPAIDLTPIKTPKPLVQRLSLPPSIQQHPKKVGPRRRRGARDEALDREYRRKKEYVPSIHSRSLEPVLSSPGPLTRLRNEMHD